MKKESKKMVPVIICGGVTGRAVVFGWADSMPKAESVVTLHRARMILYWSAACGGLLGLAANGPKDGTRITSMVSTVSDTARQVLAVTGEASKALDEWPNA